MKIKIENDKIITPDEVDIPYIEGDGIGKEITPVCIDVINFAVYKTYQNKRKINFIKFELGESAIEKYNTPIPEDIIDELKKYVIFLKGPLTTPIGYGYRSINVFLRQKLDLYACIRPIKYIKGVPSPLKNPERINVVVFRESLEDTYCGIEWEKESIENSKIRKFLENEFGIKINDKIGIGLKLISEYNTIRIAKAAIEYAINKKRKNITVVHKGNIMKYTEGYFKNIIYKFYEEKYKDYIIFEEENLEEKTNKILIKNRITDSMFQQMLLKPEEYDVIVTTNLNGDYLSEAIAGEVGGIGLIPSANINFDTKLAMFEPIHGSSPKHAGKNEANPTSIILSAAEMLDYIGWHEIKDKIYETIEKVILNGFVTYDLHKNLPHSKKVTTEEFGKILIRSL